MQIYISFLSLVLEIYIYLILNTVKESLLFETTFTEKKKDNYQEKKNKSFGLTQIVYFNQKVFNEELNTVCKLDKYGSTRGRATYIRQQRPKYSDRTPFIKTMF